MMASTMFLFRCVVLIVISSVAISALDCRDSDIAEHCDDYFNRGGIHVILEDLTSVTEFQLVKDDFLSAVASVSDEYVILDVTTELVAITDVIETGGMVQVGFFILNPSGSTVVPTAFRSEELFLMMQLNDAKVENLFGQSVKPEDPSPETLPIPIWAVAIIGYVGLVILCAVALYASRDWRKTRQQKLEKSLQMTNMEKGKRNDTKVPMTEMNQNKPEKVPILTYAEVGVQTTLRKPTDLPKEKESNVAPDVIEDGGETTANGHTVHATIENGDDDATEKDKPDNVETVDEKSPTDDGKDESADEGSRDEDHKEESAGGEIAKDMEALVEKEERHDDTKATEPQGAINEAFEDDKEGEKEEEEEDEEEDEEDDDENDNTQF